MILQKKIVRSIRKNLSFYLTGSILTGITVMLLVGAFAVSNSLYYRFDKFFEDAKVEDGEFYTMSLISQEDIAKLEKDYQVILEKQQYKDFTYKDTKLRLFTSMEKLNLCTVWEGENIASEDEALLTYKYAKANEIGVGDNLELEGASLKVSGLGIKPDYAIMLYELSDSIPNKTGFGIGIISEEQMQRLGGGTEFYSVYYKDKSMETAFRKEIYDKYGTLEYIERKANSRISLIYQEADDLVAEFSLYSPIIMIVVIAVIAMVLARTVRRDGKNIGTLMALGYRKKELVRHYMVYGMIPAIAGDILGAILCIPFSKAFCSFYFGDGEYIDYSVKIPWNLMFIALLVPILAYGLVSYLVLQGVLQAEIVPLLKGVGKEKTSKILRKSQGKLSIIYNIRGVIINYFRSITLVIGIAIATLCIVLGGSFQDSYDNLLDEKVPYAMLGGAYEYGFNEYQTENPYGGNGVFDIGFGATQDDSRFNIIGYEEENDIIDMSTEDKKPLEYGKYYMTSAAAGKYHIKAGDSFSFYNTVTMEETSVVISGIIKNDILSLVLTSKENVANIIERPVEEYNVIISKEKLTIPQELLKKESSLEDYRQMVENLSSTAGIVLKLLKVLGVLICLLIVSMMSGMILEESGRNISMLEILGYRYREVQKFVLTANHLLVPVGFLLGVPLGYLTSYSMILASAQSSGMRMSLIVRGETVIEAFLFVMVAYILATILSGRKLKKANMLECLKNAEE